MVEFCNCLSYGFMCMLCRCVHLRRHSTRGSPLNPEPQTHSSESSAFLTHIEFATEQSVFSQSSSSARNTKVINALTWLLYQMIYSMTYLKETTIEKLALVMISPKYVSDELLNSQHQQPILWWCNETNTCTKDWNPCLHLETNL